METKVLINNKDSLSWEYIYRALRNVKCENVPRYTEVARGEQMEVDAIRRKVSQKKNWKMEKKEKIRFNDTRVTLKAASLNNSEAKFKVLIDTGADLNLIRPELLLNKTIVSPSKQQLRAANGSKIKIIGETVAKIKIEGMIFEDNFIITRDITIPCIIGHGLLDKYKVTLKFGDNRMELKSVLMAKGKAIVIQLGGAKEDIASKIVKEYLDLGIIRPSESAWRSPIIIVPKRMGLTCYVWTIEG
ncbi:reverse transcriptase domain-containing protein [Vairimorpha necatrix]|uniref:Reverse transcriptase domain-containing protein n=1 Tax=Vairimorpha necatrix TaxID=6039 RepID=A0AAX4JCR0_9MICR